MVVSAMVPQAVTHDPRCNALVARIIIIKDP
jgi:hypothetical protein